MNVFNLVLAKNRYYAVIIEMGEIKSLIKPIRTIGGVTIKKAKLISVSNNNLRTISTKTKESVFKHLKFHPNKNICASLGFNCLPNNCSYKEVIDNYNNWARQCNNYEGYANLPLYNSFTIIIAKEQALCRILIN